MPYPRNRFFTGREDVLTLLHDALTAGTPVALTQPQAISGLGGIGKTQTAVEYAYRHQDGYQAVFWVSAVDETTLREGFVEIARLLGLPQAQEADQSLAVQAVKAWLEREEGWLLILDNADDLPALRSFLPLQKKGHVLMTTRAPATGAVAQKVEIGRLSKDDGALLLLRRAKLVGEKSPLDTATPADREAALALSRAVDGLPLALDQAGAFIEETPSTPARYLELYQTEAAELLAEYGNPADRDHASVRATFSLAFAKVAAASPAAGELMRCCAFLAPDAIPEEIFTGGGAALNDGPGPFGVKGLAWEKIVGEACRYSLLSRDAGVNTLSIHRLVQTVIRLEMEAGTRRAYAERLVRAVNSAFPNPEVSTWPRCERLLSHVRECVAHIAIHVLEFVEAARLLNAAGYYLHEHGQYAQAEPLYQRALVIKEHSLGLEHPSTAISVNNLGGLYNSQGRYEEALPLFLRTLSVTENLLGPEHPSTANSLNNLATVYFAQGNYIEALSLYERALSIREKVLGPEHPDTGRTLNNLGELYNSLGNYGKALPLCLRALAVCEKALGPGHPDTATSLNNLGRLYDSQDRYEEALRLCERSLAIWENALGPEHPSTATGLNNLGGLYDSRGNYAEALPLYLRALAIRVKSLGLEHPNTAISLNNLASVYFAQNDYAGALPLYEHALAIREQALKPEHPDTIQSLRNVALTYQGQGNYVKALSMYQRALSLQERTLGPEHPDTAGSLNSLAVLYFAQGDFGAAEPLLKRALETIERALGHEHPTTKLYRENYDALLGQMNP